MKKLLILFLILTLVVISACQYQKPVGTTIKSDGEIDVDPLYACRVGCSYAHSSCWNRCEGNRQCQVQCNEMYWDCESRCKTVVWDDKLEIPEIENLN